MPRAPLVSLVEVRIASVIAPSGLIGEAVFQFEGAAMTDETPLDSSFKSSSHSLSWGTRSQWSKPKPGSRQRITEWTIYPPKKGKALARISGRVSADNRWPLGFQIEPFDFQTAKVGQKLKFKQFPVALPKP